MLCSIENLIFSDFLYVSFKNLDFILPFNHNGCEPLTIDLSQSNQPKWIWDKKGFLQTDIQIKNLKDVQTALFFEQNNIYDFKSKIEVLTNFYTRLGMRDSLGNSISIMKWGEVLRDIVGHWNLDVMHISIYFETINTWTNDYRCLGIKGEVCISRSG